MALVLGLVEVCYAKPVKTGYAPVNGLQMYYEVYGSSGGMPLVLLHGGDPTIETSFGHVIEAFAKHRQVIAFEQQGHGHTADVDRPFSFDQSADDTVALLGYLKIDKADFMGYSNGGHIAIAIALKHPDVVRKLIIESAMFDRSGGDPAFWESFKNPTLETMPKELREAYLKTAPHPDQLQSYFDKSVRRMREFKGWTPEQIRSIQAPTLVLCGDHDVVRPEHAVETFRLLPHGQLAILPMTDHFGMADRRDWVPSMVDTFLDAPMPAAAPATPVASESDLVTLFRSMKYKTHLHLSLFNGNEVDATFRSFDQSREIIWVNAVDSSGAFSKKAYPLRDLKNVSQTVH